MGTMTGTAKRRRLKMYKYQCSKESCGHTWTLQEGFLNGFTLTCPKCGKGRGLFIAQVKKSETTHVSPKGPEMTMKMS